MSDSIFELIDFESPFGNWLAVTPSVKISVINTKFINKDKKELFKVTFSVLSNIDLIQADVLITTLESEEKKLTGVKKKIDVKKNATNNIFEISFLKSVYQSHLKNTNPLYFVLKLTNGNSVNITSEQFEIRTLGIEITSVTEELNEKDHSKDLFVINFNYDAINSESGEVEISLSQKIDLKYEPFLSKKVDLTTDFVIPGKISVYKSAIEKRKKDYPNSIFVLEAKVDTLNHISAEINFVKQEGKESVEEKDITIEQLSKIWTGKEEIIKSRIEDIVREMNKSYTVNNKSFKLYELFHVDTALRRAHYFAQAFVESTSTLKGAFKGEDLFYTVEALRSGYPFGAFSKTKYPKNWEKAGIIGGIKNPENKNLPRWKRIPNEKEIANIAYMDKYRDKKFHVGNIQEGDGWNFRGRGMLQITGRENYTNVQKGIDKILPDAINLKSGVDVFTAKEAVFAGFGIWAEEELYLLADKGSTLEHVNAVTAKMNLSTQSYKERRDAFANLTAKTFGVK